MKNLDRYYERLCLDVGTVSNHKKQIKLLKKKLADYQQTCGELCEKCGWRTVFPGICCVNCLYHDSLK